MKPHGATRIDEGSLPGAEVEVDLLSLIDGLDDELVKHYGGAQADQKNHKRD